MRLDIQSGLLWITDKPNKEAELKTFCDAFCEYCSDIDMVIAVNESDEYNSCFVLCYNKSISTIEDTRFDYATFKKKYKNK